MKFKQTPLFDVEKQTQKAELDPFNDVYLMPHPDRRHTLMAVPADVRNRLQTMLKCLRDRPEMYGEDLVEANDFVITMILAMFEEENLR